MKFSVRFNNDLPAKDYIKLAQAAEAAGFDQFWVSNDLFLRSAPILLTAIAVATQKIELGTCIVNPYTINPAEIAMMAATLDEVSNGRFNLGLGSGAAQFLKWVDIEQKLALTTVRETTEIIRKLLAGQPASIHGKIFDWTDEAYMRFSVQRQVPIYLGAMSPNMLKAIGEWADGGLPLLFPPEHYTNVLPYIEDGAASTGRTLDQLDIAACVWCSISEDRDAAIEILKEKIAYYGHAMSPLIWQQLGLTAGDFAPLEQAIMVEHDVEKAKSLVTDQMLAIGLVGTPQELIPRLEGLVKLGAQHLSFGPPLGPDPLEALDAIGKVIIPYFKD